jgi:Spy/CpxP family protein refolding chaperone
MSFLIRLLIVQFLISQAAIYADDFIPRIEAYLQPRRLIPADATFDESAVTAIRARPDPGTFFLRYGFGLKQNAKRLLTDDQPSKLMAVMDEHTPAHTRWHDERNTLRCQWMRVMWQYAATEEVDAAQIRSELTEWMRLRMLWTEQEHLAQYRFAQAIWKVLTPEQQVKLLSGGWKAYAKQDTGHTRGDSTAKIITRALGVPDDKAAFDAAAASWSKERVPLHANLTEAENNERRIVFAMDLNSESMVHSANLKANVAYAALYTAEADAVRRIVHASYREPKAKCQQASTAAWSEAESRFQHAALELIQLLDLVR